MAKKLGIIVLLCFSLCIGGVSAFADEGHAEADTQALIETQSPVSSVLFRQSGADIQQSVDEGKTWESYSPIEETEYFTYDEFSAWLETETENIQKLVDAGEWTEAEAAEALACYDEILTSILEGKMVGKELLQVTINCSFLCPVTHDLSSTKLSYLMGVPTRV